MRGHAGDVAGRQRSIAADDASDVCAVTVAVVGIGAGNKALAINDARQAVRWISQIGMIADAAVDDGYADPGSVPPGTASDVGADGFLKVVSTGAADQAIRRDVSDIGIVR